MVVTFSPSAVLSTFFTFLIIFNVDFFAGFTTKIVPNRFRSTLYFLKLKPRKMNSSNTLMIRVLFSLIFRFLSARNLSIAGRTYLRSISRLWLVTTKSSAYLTKFTLGLSFTPFFRRVGTHSLTTLVSPSRTIFAKTGEITPPWGTPSSPPPASLRGVR